MSGAVRRRLCRRGAVLCAALLALAWGTTPAAAQQLPPEGSAARAEYERLFQRTLAEPSDLDAAFRFAEASTGYGDYEAAIGALERMLFFNPDLGRVRLELGVLYFRLGSYPQARAYFMSAIAASDTPPDVRERVGEFLREIDRRDRPDRFIGYAQAGLRYQTNANAGPSSLNVRAAGLDALLDQRFGRKADWNAFVLGSARHIHDFGNQRGDTWETGVELYFARQFEAKSLDIDLGEVTTGPRLALNQVPGGSVRPYLLIGALGLGDTHYLTSGGVGASVTLPAGRGAVEAGVEYRRRQFDNSGLYPTAGQQSGRNLAGFVAYTQPLTASLRGQVRAVAATNNANADYYGYTQAGLSVGLSWEFNPPFRVGPDRWALTSSAAVLRTSYDEPNPIVDPGRTRGDWEYRVGVGLDAPVTAAFGVGVQVYYTYNSSSLPNYEYRNLAVTFGPTVRF